LIGLLFNSEDGGNMFFCDINELHGVISHETPLSTTTAARTANTKILLYFNALVGKHSYPISDFSTLKTP
jgi:hypothetical protein